MLTQTVMQQSTFYPAIKQEATFGEDSPQPRFLVDSDHFKVILAGLNPGQAIPVHPEALAMYHFLEGSGTMTVNEEQYPVTPGATVIAQNGAGRGIKATTRLIFLAAKSQ